MAALMSVADALASVLGDARPLPPSEVELTDAYGRVLTSDLASKRTQPPAAVSAMDGYAVRGSDVATVPTRLTVIGEVPAGKPFARRLGAGEAARIFTGGVLPAGADTVVIQEHTTRDGDIVTVGKPASTGKNVRPAGLDFKEGEVLFKRGHRLAARDLALVAGMNYPAVPVHRSPRVALFATGDELVPPGTIPGLGQIVYSNGFALMALLRAEGAEVMDLGIVPDRLEDTIAAVRHARDLDVDVLVTTGGASVGDYDLVQGALKAEGMALSFWRIAMRPGRPLMNGRLGAMHVLGLPGNPVSSFVCALLFVVPLLRKLSGRRDLEIEAEPALLGRDLPENDERADYLRATLSRREDGAVVATPFTVQDSSTMGRLALADCLVLRAPHAPAANAGTPCRIVKLAF
jgi:molybdopterin molybdotransferase